MENSDHLVAGTFENSWRENGLTHFHGLYAGRMNLWRDILPEPLRTDLLRSAPGAQFDLPGGDMVPAHDSGNVHRVPFDRIRKAPADIPVNIRFGRFYPKGLLAGLYGIYPENRTPFRCVAIDDRGIRADFNHPLAGKDVRLRFRLQEIRDKFDERGGTCTHWLESALEGPGMESRWHAEPTDFFSDNPFERADEQPDAAFYDRPRFVQHLDARAIENIGSLYARLLTPEMRVLDLMSSWTSHLPDDVKAAHVSGLGMNAQELEANRRLADYEIRDLNENPRLPYADNRYDAVICTVSVEYLVHPFEVFAEVRRILEPGGYFIVTFSNRWFPPKAIRIWTQLHEFERLGLVLEYFLQTGGFSHLNVYSLRGHPRPEDDRYYPDLRMSDPVFAVWGQKS